MKYSLTFLCAALASIAAASGFDLDQGAPDAKEIVQGLRKSAAAIPAVSFADALPTLPPQEAPAPAFDGDFIDQFQAIESDLLNWDQRYRQAPSGSWEESEARRQEQVAFDRGQELAQKTDWLEYSSPERIENFARDCAQKYQAASSGSQPESFYRTFMNLGWPAYAKSSERELTAAGHWKAVVAAADRSEQRYQAAPSGSAEETAFRELRDFAWQRAPQVLERQLGWARRSFRDFEAMAAEFDSQYQAAPSGSARETFYRQARTMAFDAAYREASRTFAWDHRPDRLYPLDQEYDGRYQNAPSGSAAETYYRKVRDLIRQYLQSQN